MFIAFLLFSALAHATPVETVCEFPDIPGTATFLVDTVDKQMTMKSTLEVEGRSIPLPAGRCVYVNVPGQKGFRCYHREGRDSFDLYPRFLSLTDPSEITKANLLFWGENGTSRSFETTLCR